MELGVGEPTYRPIERSSRHTSHTMFRLVQRLFWVHRQSITGMLIWLTLDAGPAVRLLAADGSAETKTSEGFAIPRPGRRFEFPRDHGSHPEFKIEWWYVTGHLYTQARQRYGFQATFFRRSNAKADPNSISPSIEPGVRQPFGHPELHLAHMAISDIKQQRFLFEERVNRVGWDASADETTLALRNGNWSMRLDTNNTGVITLHGSIRAEVSFSLQLSPRKPLVIFGQDGVSRKGAAPAAASHYLTFPRLDARGTLSTDGGLQTVTGQAWMDHEISSSQLDQSQEGWDWASLQLQDGREIMVYRLRKKGGATDPHSQLAWIDAQGGIASFPADSFGWKVDGHWTSSKTGAKYPIQVTLETIDPATNQPKRFQLEPLVVDQEVCGRLGGVPYWEGACRVRDARGAEVGSAYLELTGYAGNLADQFR